MVNSQTINYLKIIPFSQFSLWDTKRYTSKLISSNFNIVKLGTCITEQSKKYKIFEQKEAEFGILGVNNKEGIFDAYTQIGKDINQPYKKMETGWLAYNPYRINVGSIGIKLQEHQNEYISPAYVVFSCNDNLLPEFLFFLFKTSTFNNVIKESTTGSVRQNLTFETLKNIDIPLPSLQEQIKIVNAYKAKLHSAQEQVFKSKQLGIEIESYLYEALGIIKPAEKESNSLLQFISYKNIFEWGTDKILNLKVLKSSLYEMASFEIMPNLSESVFRGKSPKYSDNSKKFILNQKCNRWNSIEIQHSKTVDEGWFNRIDKDFFTKEGDVIINSTGEGTIGRATCINKDNEGLLYDSHILLLRVNKTLVDPLFYTYLFNSDFVQSQVDNIKSAQSTKQTELGVNNLKKIIFPQISIEKQKEISIYINSIKEEIKNLNFLSLRDSQEAIVVFEKEIFNK
ncbi:MAG: restriction endonuclease subunit S [Flavobacterium sp.]